jgi:hypothetical protein
MAKTPLVSSVPSPTGHSVDIQTRGLLASSAVHGRRSAHCDRNCQIRRRELHWHPNASEWQFYLAGKVRMTVFMPVGNARTMDYNANDAGFVRNSRISL